MHKYPLTILFFALLFAASLGSVFLGKSAVIVYERGSDLLAATFFTKSITTNELRAAYNGFHPTHRKLKIVIVPGHEPFTGGTEYKGIAERDLVSLLATKLSAELKKNPRYEVFVTRDELSWHEPLVTYFKQEWNNIDAWKIEKRDTMNALVASGTVAVAVPLVHGTANKDDARRLYGVQKWANEGDYDVMLHLHINDYPRKGKEKKHSGLAIYIPEEQYSNASASKELAQSIFKELNTVMATSTLKEEQAGVIPDQELIAIGRYNTADTANVLIEYGYIYEPQYQTSDEVRDRALSLFAEKTYRGLEAFFKESTSSTAVR